MINYYGRITTLHNQDLSKMRQQFRNPSSDRTVDEIQQDFKTFFSINLGCALRYFPPYVYMCVWGGGGLQQSP